MYKKTQNKHKQKGGEIVELALTLPIMVLFFAGFLELGIAFSNKAVIVDASRAAARQAIRNNSAGYWNAADEALKSVVTWNNSSYQCSTCTNCCKINPNDPSSATQGDDITVTLEFPLAFPILGFLIPEAFKEGLTLQGRTTMKKLPK